MFFSKNKMAAVFGNSPNYPPFRPTTTSTPSVCIRFCYLENGHQSALAVEPGFYLNSQRETRSKKLTLIPPP